MKLNFYNLKMAETEIFEKTIFENLEESQMFNESN